VTVRGVESFGLLSASTLHCEVNSTGKASLMYAYVLSSFLAVLRATVALMLIDCRYTANAAKWDLRLLRR
jgi:hypothetical protein